MTQDSDREAIVRTNQHFYQAVSQADFEAMSALWDHRPDVQCVHPGWPMLRGWNDVAAGWRGIFEAGQAMRISAIDLDISIEGNLAWVVNVEQITTVANDNLSLGYAQATNIYRRDPQTDTWRMVHHHASPKPQPTGPASGDLISFN